MSEKYFIYCRKSTNDDSKQLQSIETQKRLLLETAQKNNLKIVDTLEERKSASIIDNRPIFNEMLDRIDNGEADGILTWQINRLSRNLTELEKITNRLESGVIKVIKTPSDEYRSSSSIMMIGIQGIVAKQDIITLKKNVKDGMDTTIKSGRMPGYVPLGYINNRLDHTIVIDTERAPLIKRLFQLYSTGEYSIDSLARKMASIGLITRKRKPITKGTVEKILNNPFYYGVFRFAGEQYYGNHEQIIDKTLFDVCQEVLHPNRKTRRQKHYGIYQGKLTCVECGCSLSLDIKKKTLKTTNEGKEYRYYFCTNSKPDYRCLSHPRFNQEQIDKMILERIKAIQIDKELADWSLDMYKEKYLSEIGDNETYKKSLKTKIDSINLKLDKLLDSYLDGIVPEETYKKKEQELKNELDKAQKDKDALKDELPEVTLELLEEVKNNAINIEKMWIEGNEEVRDHLLKSLLSNCLVSNRKIAQVSWNLPWSILKDSPKTPDRLRWSGRRDSNSRPTHWQCVVLAS